MSAGERADKRRQRLIADNRCIQCSEKLAYDDIGNHRECARCREERSGRDRERYEARLQARECPSCGETVEDDYVCCPKCRKGARGRYVKNSSPPIRRNGPQPATRKKDAEASIERCGRCGLVEPHACLRGDATARQVA